MGKGKKKKGNARNPGRGGAGSSTGQRKGSGPSGSQSGDGAPETGSWRNAADEGNASGPLGSKSCEGASDTGSWRSDIGKAVDSKNVICKQKETTAGVAAMAPAAPHLEEPVKAGLPEDLEVLKELTQTDQMVPAQERTPDEQVAAESMLLLGNTTEPEVPQQQYQDREIESSSKVIHCLLEKDLDLNPVDVGKNIYTANVRKFERNSIWNSRKFVNREYTGFSSLSLGLDNIDHIGKLDFVGDAVPIKKIFKMADYTETVSLLLHRVGNSIMVDSYDIDHHMFRDRQPIPVKSEWDRLTNFVLRVIRKDLPYFLETEKSANRIHTSNVLHDLFYRCLENEDLEFKPKKEPAGIVPQPQPPKVSFEGADTKFLNTSLWDMEGYQFLIGSQTPVFQMQDEDKINDFNARVRATIAVKSDEFDKSLSQEAGIDMWLDNLMLDACQTYLCHQVCFQVTKTEVLKTESIPKEASFNPVKVVEDAKKILHFIKSTVNKSGNTYWLYKAPNAKTFAIYDVSLCFADVDLEEDSVNDPGFVLKDNPYVEGVASLLYRMCSLNSDKYHPLALKGMLRNILFVYPPEKYPLLALSTVLIHMENRLPNALDSEFLPCLNILNGWKSPEINFRYDFLPDEHDLIFPNPDSEILSNSLPEDHLVYYEKLRKILPPSSLSPLQTLLADLYNDEGEEDARNFTSSAAINQMEQMITPLHVGLDKLKVPTFMLQLTNMLEPFPRPPSDSRDSLLAATNAQEFINDRDLVMEPHAIVSGAARLVFSTESFGTIEPMEIDEEELACREFSGTSSTPISTKIKKMKLKPGEEKKLKQTAPAPKMIAACIYQNITKYHPWKWLYLCEIKMLIQIFIGVLRLMHVLNEKYDERNFKPSKKTKRLIIPVELPDLKKKLYEKVSLFLLCLAREGNKEKVPRVVMSRYCTQLAIFLNMELGRGNPEITTSGWLLSGHCLVEASKHLENSGALTKYLNDFENLLRSSLPDLWEFIKLAKDKRDPTRAQGSSRKRILFYLFCCVKDFKEHQYPLFPAGRTALRSAVVTAYSKANISSIRSQKTRQCVSQTVSKNFLKIGQEVMKCIQNPSSRLVENEKSNKVVLVQLSMEAVEDLLGYFNDATKYLPETSLNQARNCMNLAEVHCMRSRLIIPTPTGSLSRSSISAMDAYDLVLAEALEHFQKAVLLFQEARLETTDVSDEYNKARWRTYQTLIEICNNLWFREYLGEQGLQRMLDLYSSAMLFVNDDFDRGYPSKEIILFRLAETYEAMGIVKKKLFSMENKENNECSSFRPGANQARFLGKTTSSVLSDQKQTEDMLNSAAKDFESAFATCCELNSPTLTLAHYMEHMDCILATVTNGEKKKRMELSLFCKARRTLDLLYKNNWSELEGNLNAQIARDIIPKIDDSHGLDFKNTTAKLKLDARSIFTKFVRRIHQNITVNTRAFEGYESVQQLALQNVKDVERQLTTVKTTDPAELSRAANNIKLALDEVSDIPLGLGGAGTFLKPKDVKKTRVVVSAPPPQPTDNAGRNEAAGPTPLVIKKYAAGDTKL